MIWRFGKYSNDLDEEVVKPADQWKVAREWEIAHPDEAQFYRKKELLAKQKESEQIAEKRMLDKAVEEKLRLHKKSES